MRKLILPITGYLTLAALLSGSVWWWGYQNALGQLANRGQTELTLAVDRLQAHLQRFRQLSVVLAEHPGLTALLQSESDQFSDDAQRLLLETADKTGSLEIFALSAGGHTVASSHGQPARTDFHGAPFFRRAMNSALGTAQGYSQGNGRAFYSAAPVQNPGKTPVGAVVVKVDVEAVETDWRANPNILYFTDDFGIVFVSNRRDLLFRQELLKAIPVPADAATEKFGNLAISPFPQFQERTFGKHQVWRFADGFLSGLTTLRLTQPVPVIDLNARILINTAPAALTAGLQAAFAGAVSLVLGAFLWILSQRRLALTQQLSVEERAKLELEGQVNRRTQELSSANQDLRKQIAERLGAEKALRQAQQDLVQAGKLSALGQMSAGISHELNQPLMAIRSFAENAELFLDRDDASTARENLGRISDLARRMGRIIKNLRMFSRKEGEPMTVVDLNAVIKAALELNEKRLEQANVTIHWPPPHEPVHVMGGEVRLQQVVMNLLSNAIDAMDEQANKDIWISIDALGTLMRLSIRDNGPGLDHPEKLFEPFYSTKAVGKSEGMGLGLSISYGIVQSFGGQITGRNHAKGGAEFTVNLNPAGKDNP